MMVIDKSRVEKLVYWIHERERIRKAREAGIPPPWTINPVLQSVRFCNVRRMDDKVSIWLLENWYPRNTATVSRSDILATAGLARLINWPESLDGLRGARSGVYMGWDKEKARAHFEQRKSLKLKVFTGVYIINAAGGGNKVDVILKQCEDLYRAPHLLDALSMQNTWNNLQTVHGIGSFMAGQIVADLRHVWPSNFSLQQEKFGRGAWLDRHTWAPLGPGSRRGMAWLQGWDGVEKLTIVKQRDFEVFLRTLVPQLRVYDEFIVVLRDRQLEMHDLQNCLCEFDKFMRLSTGVGQAKNKFQGGPVNRELF